MIPTMTRLRGVVGFVAAVSLLAGCGSMSDFDRPEVPRRQAPPPAPVAAAPATVVEQAPVADEYEDTDASAVTDFREPLAQYGTWVDDASYGTVWVPNESVVGENYEPYVSSGHWGVDENDEYVWVSDHDESIGWAVYHYGRWIYIDGRGWSWVPGRRYAPAWVVWRTGDPGYDYIGWAPMAPAYGWHSGIVFYYDVYPTTSYVFVERSYLFYPGVRTYVVTGDRVAVVAAGTRPYGRPSNHGHGYYSTPSHGPTAHGGYVPQSSWPTSRQPANPKQSTYATPSGMNRAPARAASHAPASSSDFGRGQSRNPIRERGVSRGDPSTPSHLAPRGNPGSSGGSQAGSPGVSHGAPPSTGPSRSSHPAPSGPSTSAPVYPGRSSSPPPSRSMPSAPPASRPSAPAPHYSPAPSRPSPAPAARPSRPSSPAPSAPSRGGGGHRR